ncbi:MAG: DNA repair protein RecO [Nitrospiria bacterium]
MALLTTPAIVLGCIPLGEADKLVTFFTVKKGKLKGVAKGARRMKSRYGATLEAFTHCDLIVFEKGGDKLSRVNQTDSVHSFQNLRENWDNISLASRMVDLVSRMTPDEEPNVAIFKLLLQGLTFLESGQDRTLFMVHFASRLISLCGYQPCWDNCLKCHVPFKAGTRLTLFFSSSAGGAICSRCASGMKFLIEISQGTRAFLSASQKMDYHLSHRLKPSSLIKKETEGLFKAYLGYITGKVDMYLPRKKAV